jgi:hypothetical protein
MIVPASGGDNSSNWKTILSCVNVVTIISLTLGIAGVIVGILGWFASRRGLKESADSRARETSAQQAASDARQELLLQRATEDFRAIVEKAEQLTGAVTSTDWKIAKEVLLPLKRQLSEANGSFQKLLKGIDMDKLDVAIGAAKILVKAVQEIPANQAAVAPATVQVMIAQCDRIADLVDEIYGRLKYLKVGDVQ